MASDGNDEIDRELTSQANGVREKLIDTEIDGRICTRHILGGAPDSGGGFTVTIGFWVRVRAMRRVKVQVRFLFYF